LEVQYSTHELTWGLLTSASNALPHRHSPLFPATACLIWHGSGTGQLLVATDPHRNLTGVEEDVAWLLNCAGFYLQLGEDTFTRCRRVLGDDHPQTLFSAEQLTVSLWELGQYEQAHRLGQDTLTRWRRILGDNHPDTLRSAYNLAVTLRESGQHEPAYRLGEDTLTRMRRVLGDEDPNTLRLIHNLTTVLVDLREHD
jgi:hypothetical protein